MTEPIHFIVYGRPVAWARVADKEMCYGPHGNPYMKKFDPNSKDKLNFLAKAALHRPDTRLEAPLAVDLKFYFERPEAHYGRQNGQPYLKPDAATYYCLRKRHDIDNLIKFVLDALMGPFWEDDSMIARLAAEKLYTDKLPYTEITIKPI